MASWKDMSNYIHEAVRRFLINKSSLPIRFISSELAPSGENKYLVYFEDTKLTAWYKDNKFNGDSKFRVIVTDSFLYDHTQGIDLAAHIPATLEQEKKIVLRIAYAILVAWQRCFIDAYKLVAPNKYDVTFANAKKWYDELK